MKINIISPYSTNFTGISKLKYQNSYGTSDDVEPSVTRSREYVYHPFKDESNESIKEVLRQLKKGKHVCIFPQGTRMQNPQIEEGSAKEGVAMFSIRTGTPVVPMMFTKKIKMFFTRRKNEKV